MSNYRKTICLVVSMTSLLFHSCDAQNKVEKKPNIIFFFTDDQSYDSMKYFGNPNTKTPNLDKLAESGVAFLRHYNTTAICMASRAQVMTGLYEYKTGCNFDRGALGTRQWSTSYPLLLKEAGYRVGFGGKFGFSISDTSDDFGKEGEAAEKDFDFWVGSPGQTSYMTKENKSMAKYAEQYPHSTRAYGAATIDFINESVKGDQPFCMSVFFKAPHKPAEPDPVFDTVYKNTVFRKLPNFGREAGKHLAEQSRMGRQYGRFVEWGYDKEDTYQEELRKYNQLIYGVDYAIGMIMDQLKKLKIDDNTIIVFASDNGYFNGSHGLGSKELPYEESARAPLIIVDPRMDKKFKGKQTSSLSANVDITATILDFAGIKAPTVYDGKSLRPILSNTQLESRTSLPIVQVWGPKATYCLTVMEKQYKYIYWNFKDEAKGIHPTEELFDIINDPYEMKNLASSTEFKSQLIKMRALYDKQLDHWKKEGVKNHGYDEAQAALVRKVQ
ncbi:sulfatase family protein [Flavobacterium algicola]|uniref:sulfatase family protein n=1 Tax=Flavobacterium algicola TaxID=556529 RepID=UPI001EFE9CEF|nr:sulfatase [Flavobacterium algicola]MCG9792339.1 sulfatase [Flavobacterium algicola]